MRNTYVFRDVSHDAAAVATAIAIAPAWRKTLLELGFVSLGVLESRNVDSDIPHIQHTYAPADAAFILHTLQVGTRQELFTSPDRQAVATLEPFFGGPILLLRTVTEAGTVIETVTMPVRGATLRWWGRVQAWLFAFPHPWMLPDYPGGHYRVIQVQPRDPVVVWQQHQACLTTLAPPAAVRPQVTLTLYLATVRRALQIQAHDATMKHRAGTIALLVAVGGMLLPILAYVQYSIETFGNFVDTVYAIPLFFIGYFLSFVVPVVLVLSVQLPLIFLSTRLIVPYLTGPRRQPLDELVAQVVLEA